MEKEIDGKIEKLWELLEEHSEKLKELVEILKERIQNRDLISVGEIAGEIQMIAVSDVCYTITIEILEDLKKPKTRIAG